MTPKEWHLEALHALERALFEYQVANQAMYDARRALECAGDPDRAALVDGMAAYGGPIPGRLQIIVNALRSDPILDEPKDIHSAGEDDADIPE